MQSAILNEVPEHMAQEFRQHTGKSRLQSVLNEVPEHMAQECIESIVVHPQ